MAGFGAPIAVSERARRPDAIAVRKRERQSRSDWIRTRRPTRRPHEPARRISVSLENERVEAGGDPAQAPRDVLSGMDVEMVEEKLAGDVVRHRERVDQFAACILDPRAQPCVELDAVAGPAVLRARGLPGSAPRRDRAPDALAQFDGERFDG